MADNPIYHQKEIERYLGGELSQADMHAFEKAMLDDPFLSDALEGYKRASNDLTRQNLKEIENRLFEQKDKSKHSLTLILNQTWIKIAAAVIVVLFASILTYNAINSYNNNPYTLATNDAKGKPELNDSIGPVAAPTISYVQPLTAKEKTSIASTSTTLTTTDNQTQTPAAKTDSSFLAFNDLKKDEVFTDEPIATKITGNEYATKEFSPTKKPSIIKGKVIDQSGEPLAFATIRNNEKNVAVVADSKGEFLIKAPDSTLTVQVSSAGFADKKAQLSSITSVNKVVLEEENLSLSEVVVTGMTASRKRKETVNESDQEQLVYQTTVAMPKGGKKALDKYLTSQVKHFKDSTGISLKQTILLEFETDKKGRPVNIIAKGYPDKILAERAIYILQNGPLWRGKSGKVEIVF